MRTFRPLLVVAAFAPALALLPGTPAFADTANHRVCSANYPVALTANWPFTISVRGDHTISGVSPGSPYLSGLVPPGVSIVSGSDWTTWSETTDHKGITVWGHATLQLGWITTDASCQAFWSF